MAGKGPNCYQLSAYGEPADRIRLDLVAKAAGVSQSRWLVMKIREAYRELYGDADPHTVVQEDSCPPSPQAPPSA